MPFELAEPRVIHRVETLLDRRIGAIDGLIHEAIVIAVNGPETRRAEQLAVGPRVAEVDHLQIRKADQEVGLHLAHFTKQPGSKVEPVAEQAPPWSAFESREEHCVLGY